MPWLVDGVVFLVGVESGVGSILNLEECMVGSEAMGMVVAMGVVDCELVRLKSVGW